MAEWVNNRVFIRAFEGELNSHVKAAVEDINLGGYTQIMIDRQDDTHAVLDFRSVWEPPVEAARRIRERLDINLCGWFVLPDSAACGFTQVKKSLDWEGFLPRSTRMDINTTPLNFRSVDGF